MTQLVQSRQLIDRNQVTAWVTVTQWRGSGGYN